MLHSFQTLTHFIQDDCAQKKQSRNQKRQLSSRFPHPRMAIEQLNREWYEKEAPTPQSSIRQGAKCNNVANANIMDT